MKSPIFLNQPLVLLSDLSGTTFELALLSARLFCDPLPLESPDCFS